MHTSTKALGILFLLSILNDWTVGFFFLCLQFGPTTLGKKMALLPGGAMMNSMDELLVKYLGPLVPLPHQPLNSL